MLDINILLTVIAIGYILFAPNVIDNPLLKIASDVLITSALVFYRVKKSSLTKSEKLALNVGILLFGGAAIVKVVSLLIR